MEFAYFDESGDSGAKGSKNLVMVVLCTRKKDEIDKIIRKAKQRLLDKSKTSKWLNKKGGEIKWNGFPDKVLLVKTLKELSQLEMSIYYIAIKKDDKGLTYQDKNTAVGSLFYHIKTENSIPSTVLADTNFFKRESSKQAIFCLDKYEIKEIEINDTKGGSKKQKSIVMHFHQVDEEDAEKHKQAGDNVIQINHVNSTYYNELQALDLICGSIFYFVENGKDEYIKILRSGKAKVKCLTIEKK